MTTDLQDAIAAISKAQRMTTDLLAMGRADYHLFVFADGQLRAMARILSEGRQPSEEEKAGISVGRMAIRELEGGPLNDYALALEEAAGSFRML